ncbi:MAG TPA: hypothetical protein VFG76_07210 [Candidatus Polarisedimenticolia bacterium]|nr:hypothetical protein [Candidatus Polarisedimenticolia bacterium]
MKYKHKGYRDSEKRGGKDEKRDPPKPRTPEERQLRHMMERSANVVLRCHQCSAVAHSAESLTSLSTCASCGAALHVCRNCANFDTAARWECRAPIESAVPDKTAANECAHFKANTVLDATGRRAGSGAAAEPGNALDARAAFENLFKKK